MGPVGTPPVHEVVETVFRIESARIIAAAARIVCDVGLAEQVAQDALVAALEQWPVRGIPDQPGPWLISTARHRAVDLVRREQNYARKLAEVGRTLDEQCAPELPDPDAIDDDLLRLIFVACHPVLSTTARIALTLKLLGGLTTGEIARATLSAEAAVAQRIVRAKRVLAARRVPFEVPTGAERAARLSSVLEVIYLIFNEGYSATAGDDLLRPALCEESLRLARVLAALLPAEPETHGLLALLSLQASRSGARVDAAGAPVLLADQDRGRWNRLLIRLGMESLLLAGTGPYSLQAAIAACHARAARFEDTDWATIAVLYERLYAVSPSPVVLLNRAVAVAQADGPRAALVLVDALADDPALRGYHLLASVRGDLLARLGRDDAARAEFVRAADLTRNRAERALLLRRADAVGDADGRGRSGGAGVR
ncbi:RNA polymerase sigma factor [Rhodococcus sp. NPDC058505]|uniref:RNA polymerase sigma factor n=1 Tax=Rhodococcus sp. NPDC058505 TaxID=3346531 RepID=UPI003646CE55